MKAFNTLEHLKPLSEYPASELQAIVDGARDGGL